MEKVLVGSIGLSVASSPAIASGGATAGGAYLLSAKQRYNNRVIAGVKAFLALDSRDLSQVDAFFSTTEEGGWEDLSGAGYLLANAFRTSSTKAPDNLPSVKASITVYCWPDCLLCSQLNTLFIPNRSGRHLQRTWNFSKKLSPRRMAKQHLLLTKQQ